MKALKMCPPSSEISAAGGKLIGTLRAVRKAVCRDRNPLDRLERTIERLSSQASEKEILEVLHAEHLRLKLTRDCGIRYTPPDGKFKRLAEAWSFIAPSMREACMLIEGDQNFD